MTIKCTVLNCNMKFKSAKGLKTHQWMKHFRPGASAPAKPPSGKDTGRNSAHPQACSGYWGIEKRSRFRHQELQAISEIRNTDNMQVVLLRVGIDSGSGGIHGPLFKDGSFEFVPILDEYNRLGVNKDTYANTIGRKGRFLIDYFPDRRRERRKDSCFHDDPEFETFTYGDPTRPKAGLKNLRAGDLLIFYAGLAGWNFPCAPALYIIGYFEVLKAGLAGEFTEREIARNFSRNFHVRHRPVFNDQRDRLVLVKGGPGSKLLLNAALISSEGTDCNGRRLKVLSEKMQNIFGDFDGHLSIQRSPPRWVAPPFVDKAVNFVRSLE
jgi:hypothetical protein